VSAWPKSPGVIPLARISGSRNLNRGAQLFVLRVPRRNGKLLPETTPVETSWDVVSDDEGRSPVEVRVLHFVELLTAPSTVESVVGLSG